jgi:hypothetical protein
MRTPKQFPISYQHQYLSIGSNKRPQSKSLPNAQHHAKTGCAPQSTKCTVGLVGLGGGINARYADELPQAVGAWRKAHPGMRAVEFIRFDRVC